MAKAICYTLIFVWLAACSRQAIESDLGTSNPKAALLVDELASEFSPMHPSGWHPMADRTPSEGSHIFSDDDGSESLRDLDAERVRLAYDQLTAMGIDAFPDLIRSLDDDRHSYSAVYAAWHNHTVGDACRMIIQHHVDYWGHGYKSRDTLGEGHIVKPRFIFSLYTSGKLSAWWYERQDLPLRDLQIEALLWTIEQEEDAGFVDDNQRRLILTPLKDRLAELGYTSASDQ